MPFLERLSYLLTGPTPERKAAWDLVPIGVQGRPQYPATDTGALFAAYKRSPLVYAAVNARADSAVGPRLIVQRRANADAEWAEEPGHGFRRLWMRPNPQLTEAGLVSAIIQSADITGRFYGEIERAAAQNPVTVYPLNAGQMAQQIGGRNVLTGYEYREGTTKVPLTPEQVLAYHVYDPENPRWGALSRVAICAGEVDADNALTDFVRAFFNNSGVPSGILKVKGTLTQDRADELRARWRDRYGRQYGRQQDTAVLDDNADYQQIGATTGQVENAVLRMITESRVFMTFGVPPLIVYSYAGLLRATYSNLKEAWASYWDSTLFTLYEQLRTWLTWALLTEWEDPEAIYAERVRLSWDYSAVPWFKEDVTAKETRARAAFLAGGLTLNEYRAALGEQSDAAGDYYLRQGAQVEVPAGAGGTGAVPRVYSGAAPVPALIGQE